MIIVITGVPGSGKTTICKRIYEHFKSRLAIAGFITEEIKRNGKRVGFKAIDLSTGKSMILAHEDFYDTSSYRVGKYGVNLREFENFVLEIEKNVANAKLVIVDEVGKMELLSNVFENFVLRLLNIYSSSKILLFSVHYFYNHPLCIELRENLYDEKFVVTKENRERVFSELKELLEANLLQ